MGLCNLSVNFRYQIMDSTTAIPKRGRIAFKEVSRVFFAIPFFRQEPLSFPTFSFRIAIWNRVDWDEGIDREG